MDLGSSHIVPHEHAPPVPIDDMEIDDAGKRKERPFRGPTERKNYPQQKKQCWFCERPFLPTAERKKCTGCNLACLSPATYVRTIQLGP